MLGIIAAFRRGLLPPLARLAVVLCYATTVGVNRAEAVHGIRVVLGGRLLVPLARPVIIPCYAVTLIVKEAEVSHGVRVVLGGRLLVPLARLAVVLRHA